MSVAELRHVDGFDYLVAADVDNKLPDPQRQQLLDDLERWRDQLLALLGRRIEERTRLRERQARWQPTAWRRDEIRQAEEQHEVEQRRAGLRIRAVQDRITEVNRLRVQHRLPTVEAALEAAVVRAAVAWRMGHDDGSKLLAATDGLIEFRGYGR